VTTRTILILAIVRRYRLDWSLVLAVVVAIGMSALGSTTIALPGTRPTAAGLAILVAATMAAMPPSTTKWRAYEVQSAKGLLKLRVLGVAMTLLALAPVIVAARWTNIGITLVIVWLAFPLAIGFFSAGRLGDGAWAPIMVVGLVLFALAGQIDSSGDYWFIEFTSREDVAVGSVASLGLSLAVYLTASLNRLTPSSTVAL